MKLSVWFVVATHVIGLVFLSLAIALGLEGEEVKEVTRVAKVVLV